MIYHVQANIGGDVCYGELEYLVPFGIHRLWLHARLSFMSLYTDLHEHRHTLSHTRSLSHTLSMNRERGYLDVRIVYLEGSP